MLIASLYFIDMRNNTNDEQENLERIYEYAANLLINEKKSPYEVRSLLIQQGLDAEIASLIVENLETQVSISNRGDSAQANQDILQGTAWLIGGSIVTALTYAAASDGGIYVITYGAIIFGAVQLIKGIIEKNKN